MQLYDIIQHVGKESSALLENEYKHVKRSNTKIFKNSNDALVRNLCKEEVEFFFGCVIGHQTEKIQQNTLHLHSYVHLSTYYMQDGGPKVHKLHFLQL